MQVKEDFQSSSRKIPLDQPAPTPPNEDEFIPDLVLSSPDDSFSWDGWKQPSAPFLWTLTDIAHALGSDFETA